MARFKAPDGAKLESRRAVLAHLEEGGAAREVLDRVRAGYRGTYNPKKRPLEEEVGVEEKEEEEKLSVTGEEEQEAWLQVLVPEEEGHKEVTESPSKRRKVEDEKEFKEAIPKVETPAERKRRKNRESARRVRARERQARLEGVKEEPKEEGLESAELDNHEEKSNTVEEMKTESEEEKLQRQRESKAAWQRKYRAQKKAEKDEGNPENTENILESQLAEETGPLKDLEDYDIESGEAEVEGNAQIEFENLEEMEASPEDNPEDSYDEIIDDTAADNDTECVWNNGADELVPAFVDEPPNVEQVDDMTVKSIDESIESMQTFLDNDLGGASVDDESIEDEDDEEEESMAPKDPIFSYSSSAFDDMATIFVENPAVASVAAMEEVVERHGLATEQVNWWFVKVRRRSEGVEEVNWWFVK